jgi:hypothetical protein
MRGEPAQILWLAMVAKEMPPSYHEVGDKAMIRLDISTSPLAMLLKNKRAVVFPSAFFNCLTVFLSSRDEHFLACQTHPARHRAMAFGVAPLSVGDECLGVPDVVKRPPGTPLIVF